jgi:hypothetical protein
MPLPSCCPGDLFIIACQFLMSFPASAGAKSIVKNAQPFDIPHSSTSLCKTTHEMLVV